MGTYYLSILSLYFSHVFPVIHKIVVRPNLVTFICSKFDMNDHSTNVFQDMINSLGAFVQNVLHSGSNVDPSSDSDRATGLMTASGSPMGPSYGPGSSPQPGFSYRNVWKPLTISFIGGQTKDIYLDVSDRYLYNKTDDSFPKFL